MIPEPCPGSWWTSTVWVQNHQEVLSSVDPAWCPLGGRLPAARGSSLPLGRGSAPSRAAEEALFTGSVGLSPSGPRAPVVCALLGT